MPKLRKRSEQPSPVTAQVELPPEFPPIPQVVLERFPEAAQWQEALTEFWTRTKQSIQSAQTQAANYANARVIYSVDQFLIYAKGGIPQPMFALDSTGVKLGDVLTVNTPGRRVYIGEGVYDSAETPFYIDANGFFSLGDQLTWNPETATLTIEGTFIIDGGTIGGFDVGSDYIRDTNNTMGLASTVTGGDDVRFWSGATFVNRATAPFRVLESGDIVANNATIVGTISGRSTATVAAAINSSGNLVNDVVNARLDSSAKTMLSDFSFGTTDFAGALKSGTIAWNTTTGAITGGSGVLVYRGGIVGAASGVPTFTLDATTGNATFAGTITASSGTIGGFDIGADYIRDAANSMGLASTVTGGDDVRFWAGAAFASRSTAPFRVTEAGLIFAAAGTIGGWAIAATTLSSGSTVLYDNGTVAAGTGNDVAVLSAAVDPYRIWVGNVNPAVASFYVTKTGVMNATGATISGNITATTGSIGGFDIGSDYLRDTGNSFGMASTVTGGDDVRLWAGNTFANRGSAPFRVTESGALIATSATISGTITSSSGTIGGFTIGVTTLTAGSGDGRISLDSSGSLFLGTADGTHKDARMTAGAVAVTGYSPNYWINTSGITGKIEGGDWTYAGSYNYNTLLTVDFSTGNYTSLGGIMRLRTVGNALRITLDGTNGDGDFFGDITANSVISDTIFTANGSPGITDTIIAGTTQIFVQGGIISGWSP